MTMRTKMHIIICKGTEDDMCRKCKKLADSGYHLDSMLQLYGSIIVINPVKCDSGGKWYHFKSKEPQNGAKI